MILWGKNFQRVEGGVGKAGYSEKGS
jgi:hypothetical protein